MRNIFPRCGVWYYRKQIPAELLKFYRTKELRGSLRTCSKREAERLIHAKLADIEAEFDRHRAELGKAEAEAKLLQSPEFLAIRDKVIEQAGKVGVPAPYRNPTIEQATSWIGKPANEIEFDSRHMSRSELNYLTELTTAELDSTASSIASHIKAVAINGDEVEDVIPKHIAERVAAYARELVKAEQTSILAAQSMLNGETKSVSTVADDRSLEVLKAGWVRERQPAYNTVRQMNAAILRFSEVNGLLAYQDINPEHCRKFKESILSLEAKSGTKHKTWGMIRTLLSHAQENNLINSNPFSNISLRLADDSTTRDVFSQSTLHELFTTIGRQSEAWWQCRIALYTGARLGEIIQLTRQDIVSFDDTCFFRITDENGKRVKTRSSIRQVPVHEQLVRDGVLDWLPATGRLFSTSAAVASQRVNRRIAAVAPSGTNLVFHSFRHTFISRVLRPEWQPI
jgi:integrase